MADAPITLFMPLGSDRSNAGLTIRAESIDEVNAILDNLNTSTDEEESNLSKLLNNVQVVKAGVELIFPASTVVTKPTNSVTHPQAQSSPADAPSCTHGAMKWREGTSAKGNAYKGWFCPAPQGTPGGQCKPSFVK